MLWSKFASTLSTLSVLSSHRVLGRTFVRLPSVRFANNALFMSTSSGGSASTGWCRICESEEDVEDLASYIASVAGNGDVILMRGDLGAGKTTFARSLIRTKFDDPSMRVTSPSYLLDNTYEYDDGHIHHMDLYRLPTGCDLSILGIPEIYSSALCIIEWPERMGDKLPSEHLDVEMIIDSDGSRAVRLTSRGEKWTEKLDFLFDGSKSIYEGVVRRDS